MLAQNKQVIIASYEVSSLAIRGKGKQKIILGVSAHIHITAHSDKVCPVLQFLQQDLDVVQGEVLLELGSLAHCYELINELLTQYKRYFLGLKYLIELREILRDQKTVRLRRMVSIMTLSFFLGITLRPYGLDHLGDLL